MNILKNLTTQTGELHRNPRFRARPMWPGDTDHRYVITLHPDNSAFATYRTKRQARDDAKKFGIVLFT